MRVAVTGSHGLIGSVLVETLRRSGHDVVQLVRSAPTGPGEVRWDPASGSVDLAGLAGVGDVITTCYSPFGRNRAVGASLGQGLTLAETLSRTASVAEGIPTARSLHEWAAQRGVEMPIAEEVYRILFEGKSPRQAVTALMDRLPKDEW